MNLVSRQIINDAAHDLAILFLQSRAGEPSVTDTFPVVEILGGESLSGEEVVVTVSIRVPKKLIEAASLPPRLASQQLPIHCPHCHGSGYINEL